MAQPRISFFRKKMRTRTQTPALIRFGAEVEAVLRSLPAAGPLFPKLSQWHEKHRAKEFKQRCVGLGIEGVTLHSYRYAWAERALKCGYPERFAQQALGHNSKAVHRAYAKHAKVIVPSLDDWEKNFKEDRRRKVVAVEFQPRQTESSDLPQAAKEQTVKIPAALKSARQTTVRFCLFATKPSPFPAASISSADVARPETDIFRLHSVLQCFKCIIRRTATLMKSSILTSSGSAGLTPLSVERFHGFPCLAG